jgi:membrane-bound lytic murein transglycosylase D
VSRAAFPILILAAVVAYGGCATTGVQRSDDAPDDERVTAASPAPPTPIPDEVVAEVLFAREKARQGLVADAETAYDRALGILRPLAERDPRLSSRVEEIEAERDRIVADVEARLAEAGETPARDEAEAILIGPEPELDPEALEVVEEAAASVTPDWPVVRNERVLAWIEAYTGNLRPFIERSIARSGRYEERFKEIFAEEGVPQDLIYLAHTESGFKYTAYSRAHAKGIFQFIAPTGRRYGMRIDWWIDERSDPEIAARASASYLRDLYEEFQSWELALAAYNGGEGRVRRSIRHAGTDDFWELIRRRYFRRETRNYVPAIMAATLIAKNPDHFGFGHVVKQKPVGFEVVTVPTPTDVEVIAKSANASVEEIRDLNPALRRMQTPPNEKNYPVRVPLGSAENFDRRLAQVPLDQRITKTQHLVRRGDTLSGIARRYGTSVRAIQSANRMGRRTLLRVGQVLVVPRGPGAPSTSQPMQRASDGTYKVRRGDSLMKIARRFGVTVSQLQSWNRLGRSTRIYAGQRLRIGSGGSAPSPREKAPTASTYVVRRGDTLWEIARDHRVSLSSLMRHNGLSRRSTLRPGQRIAIPGRPGSSASSRASAGAESASGGTYVVRRGDNPWTIARRHGVSLRALLAANGLSSRSTLQPGQRLVIPGGTGAARETSRRSSAASSGKVHVVRRGENPWTISRRHGVSLGALLSANGLSSRSTLQPGQRLVIPGAGASAEVPQPKHHVVRRGETLSRIASRYGMSVGELCRINQISPSHTIYPGDRIALR